MPISPDFLPLSPVFLTMSRRKDTMAADTLKLKPVNIPYLLQLIKGSETMALDPTAFFKNGVVPKPGDEVTMRCYEVREQDDNIVWALTWEVQGSEPYVLPAGESDLAWPPRGGTTNQSNHPPLTMLEQSIKHCDEFSAWWDTHVEELAHEKNPRDVAEAAWLALKALSAPAITFDSATVVAGNALEPLQRWLVALASGAANMDPGFPSIQRWTKALASITCLPVPKGWED